MRHFNSAGVTLTYPPKFIDPTREKLYLRAFCVTDTLSIA